MKRLKILSFNLGAEDILSKNQMKKVLGGSQASPDALCAQSCVLNRDCLQPECSKCVWVNVSIGAICVTS